MAGHSKWSTIKHKKGKTDAQRARVFTKIGREIAVAVKEGGGGDPNNNAKLRDVIAKAKAANMPNDNIQRSIKKAAGEGANVHYEEIVYEGYAPGGVAVIVETLTDNRNRTAGEMRHIFDKYGGSLGTSGCVGWMFDTKGVLVIEEGDGIDEEALMMQALDAGAEDFENAGGAFEIICEMAQFSILRESLEEAGYAFVSAGIERIPQNDVTPDNADIPKIATLLEMLEDNDDVQNVYHNAILPDDEA
jgi:YebC/PmpR family DNA-binding regulatory protein